MFVCVSDVCFENIVAVAISARLLSASLPPSLLRVCRVCGIPPAFRWVFQGFIEVGYPDMAVCALLQTQVAERGGLATHLEWSDLVETKGKLRVKSREVNGKTQLRTVPLNHAVAEWLRPFQSREACLQVQVQVKQNNSKGHRKVPRRWPHTSSDESAASDVSHATSRLFPGLTVNYFERILWEKVRPWLTQECARNPDACSDLGTVDIARIRTHSFRRGPVTWLKDFVKSDVVVGGVAGMCASRVRSCYDELNEKRVKKAQAHLASYVTCIAGLRQESDTSDAIYIVESDLEVDNLGEDVIIISAAIKSVKSDESADESIEEISEVTGTPGEHAKEFVKACLPLSERGRQKREVHRSVCEIVREDVCEAIAGLRSNIPAEPSRARRTCRVR